MYSNNILTFSRVYDNYKCLYKKSLETYWKHLVPVLYITFKTVTKSLETYWMHHVKWTKGELQQIDQRTRKPMTMHKALDPRDDIDRLYVSRKKGRRGLASIHDNVYVSIRL